MSLTLVQILKRRAIEMGDRAAFTFLPDTGLSPHVLTYSQLDREARRIAAVLQRHCKKGDRALLVLPSSTEFITAFFGCLYAGVWAVPAYPPRPNRRSERVVGIVSDCTPAVALTNSTIGQRLRFDGLVCEPTCLALDALDAGGADDFHEPALSLDDVALLQYTSGSTAEPRGVMVTHSNLAANQQMIRDAFETTNNSVIAGWLPLYHDMGLIGNVMQTVYAGAQCILMSPAAFLQKPLRWLHAIGTYRAEIAGGPDFAYDLCARRITDEQKESLDLSSWEVAFNGAEPIRTETLDRFSAAFEPCGFRRTAFFPCYGLAEATLMVSGSGRGAAPSTYPHPGNDAVRQLVSCGRPAAGQQLLIVEPETALPVAPGRTGEVWVAGPHIASGYWSRDSETVEVFGARLASGAGPFLRTGDLGFLAGGDLVITGRRKDLIIIRGRNLYPQDIERTVEESCPAVRPHSAVAFGNSDRAGEEHLVVVAEADPRRSEDWAPVTKILARAIAVEHEIAPAAVMLTAPGSLPKTSSGKKQRQLTRQLYSENALPILARWDGPAEWLSSVCAKLLRTDAGTLADGRSLIDHGMDSLQATELLHAIERQTGVVLPVSNLLGDMSLAALYASLHPSGSARELPYRPRRKSFRASPGQQALFYLQRKDPASCAYNVAHGLRFPKGIDAGLLRDCWNILAQRHPTLRLQFREQDGVLWADIRDSAGATLRIENAAGLSDDGLQTRIRDHASEPFDLAAGPLWRAILFERPADAVLLCVLHHSITDFWSQTILLRDLAMLYSGRAAGLNPLEATYAEFAESQIDFLASPESDPARTFWREHLADANTALDLPADHPRQPAFTSAGATFRFELTASMARRIEEFSRNAGITPFVTVLASWALLLSRLSDRNDVIVGCPAVGRLSVDMAGVAGYFVNTLPLRVPTRDGETFQQFAARAAESVREALRHQSYPVGEIVRDLGLARDASRPALFQAMLSWQQPPAGVSPALAALAIGQSGAPIPFGELEAESWTIDLDVALTDVQLTLAPIGDAIAGHWEFNTDLFDRETIANWHRWWTNLLDQVLVSPQAPATEIPLLTVTDRRAITQDWNATAARYAGADQSLPALIHAQVIRTPDVPAVLWQTETLTYATLWQRAGRLARWLTTEGGVKPEDRVALFLERSPELMVALIGTLAAGGVYTPFDPAHPADRAAVILADSTPLVVLTQKRFLPVVTPLAAKCGARVLALDSGQAAAILSTGEPALSIAVATGNQAACLLYTSGSTGVPKGVVNTHEGLVNRILWMQAEYGLQPTDRVLQKTPYTFDVAGWEFFWPLLIGAAVVMAEPGAHRDTYQLAELIRRFGVTTLHFVPSMLAAFLEEPGLTHRCCSLRLVFSSGEALPRPTAMRCAELLPYAALHNLYGPTEAAIDVTAWPCAGECGTGFVPLGRPIGNIRVYVLDRRGAVVPPGVAGEIYLGGLGLARGYCSRPDLTAERFVPDPVSGEAGSRLYRTGDRGRWRRDGALEFLGRLDGQVKLRGQRLELGEIEAGLRSQDGVRDAAVAVHESGANRSLLLCAYVVGDGSLNSAALRERIAQKLPGYMVPQQYVFLPRLPLTANGKLDRRALPAPGWELDEPHYAPPENQVQRDLAAVWQQVLNVPQAGIDDNFYSLGGDSIRSLQVKSLAAERRLDISLTQLLQFPTIRQLAPHAVASRTEERSVAPFAMIARQDRERMPASVVDAYPLTYLQRGLVFHSEHSPDYLSYVTSIRISAPFDKVAIERALACMTHRHEMMRTAFEMTQFSEPLQVVYESASIVPEVTDLTGKSEPEQEAALAAFLSEERYARFEWDVAPLFRFHVHLRVASFQLTLTEPLLDGWSVATLLTELIERYHELRTGAGRPAPSAMRARFADYVALEREIRQSREAATFWSLKLAGNPPQTFPSGRDGSVRPTVERLWVTLPTAVAEEVPNLARRIRSPLKSVMLAAHLVALARVQQQNDIVTGLLYNGRPEMPDGDRVLGVFLNAVPFRLDVAGKSWRQLVDAVTGLETELVPYRRFPLALLIQRLNAGQPFFTTAFNYTHFHAYQKIRHLDGASLEGGDASDQTYFALTAQFNRDDESGLVRVALDYRTVELTAPQAGAIARVYAGALAELSETPEAIPVAAQADEPESIQKLEQLIARLEQMPQDEVLKALAVQAAER